MSLSVEITSPTIDVAALEAGHQAPDVLFRGAIVSQGFRKLHVAKAMLAFAVDESWAGRSGEAVLRDQGSVQDRAVFNGALQYDCLLIRGEGSALTAVYAEGIGAELKVGSLFTGTGKGPSGTLVMIYRARRRDSAAAMLLASRCAPGSLVFGGGGAKRSEEAWAARARAMRPFAFLRSALHSLPGQ